MILPPSSRRHLSRPRNRASSLKIVGPFAQALELPIPSSNRRTKLMQSSHLSSMAGRPFQVGPDPLAERAIRDHLIAYEGSLSPIVVQRYLVAPRLPISQMAGLSTKINAFVIHTAPILTTLGASLVCRERCIRALSSDRSIVKQSPGITAHHEAREHSSSSAAIARRSKLLGYFYHRLSVFRGFARPLEGAICLLCRPPTLESVTDLTNAPPTPD